MVCEVTNLDEVMDWIMYALLIILFLCELLSIYFSALSKQYGKNTADILQNREKSYESEKGKNLATKEDIQEITKKVEDVKSVVTLSNQKRYERMTEQEHILLKILHEATKILQSQNKLLLYLYDTTSRVRYGQLVEHVNDTITQFYHLCNLATVSIALDGIDQILGDLSIATTYLGLQVNVTAANAANLVEQFNNQWDYALTQAKIEYNKTKWMALSVQTKKQIQEMQGKPVDGKEKLSKAIEGYCFWLKQLYGKDFFVLGKDAVGV